MKTHPRIYKFVKWGGAAATVLLVVMWVGSGWSSVCWHFASDSLVVSQWGGIEYWEVAYTPEIPIPAGLHARFRSSPYVEWRIVWQNASAGRGYWPAIARLPYWLLVGLSLLANLIAWGLYTLARRRAGLNLCSKCSYDRAGLAAGAICPECGSMPR